MSARQGKTTSPASSTLYAPSKWLTGPFPVWVVVKFSQVGFGWVKCCAKKGVLCARDGPPRSRREGQEFLASPIPPETQNRTGGKPGPPFGPKLRRPEIHPPIVQEQRPRLPQ